MTDTRHESPVAEADENYARRRRIFVGEIAGAYGELYRELFSRPRVYAAKAVAFRGGPQHWVRGVINPGRTPATQLFECHIDVYAPGAHGQRHAHMNSAVFYILDGEGYDIHDGVRYDWRAGDVCIVEPGCVHQHFNASATEPARMLIMKAKPAFLFAHLLYQRTVEPEPAEPVPGFEDFQPSVFDGPSSSGDAERDGASLPSQESGAR